MVQKSSRATKNGNDFFCEIRTPNSSDSLKITYWDLWIAIIFVNNFDSDWDKMIKQLRERKESTHYLNDAYEALMSHMFELRRIFSEAGLTIDDILVEVDPDLLKTQEKKAKRKIIDMNFMPKEKSEWMIHTPRKIREVRAMRGHWDCFPVNPQSYADSLKRIYKYRGFYTEDESFSLERKLSGFLDKHRKRLRNGELFALYRAFLTVVLEKVEMVDDSSGVIGSFYEEVFAEYIYLDRAKLEMQSEDFFLDLLELIIWEDYGFTDQYKSDFFANISKGEIPLVENILQNQRAELSDLELDYQAEKALTILGMLYTQQKIFDKFVPIARKMGTREWSRITTMSEMAEMHQKDDVALRVYEVCLEPGFHEEFLLKKYQELKKRISRRKSEELL